MKLTDEERSTWQAIVRQETTYIGTLPVTRSRFHNYPKAARHYTSLFPNHYLDIVELKEEPKLTDHIDDFKTLLDGPEATERNILRFISSRHAYFIVGSLLKSCYDFGHHDAFLFKEFKLGTSHIADYLLVGRNSHGWHFVFVEFESPSCATTTAEGEFGHVFRKGLAQVEKWRMWIEANYALLREYFDRCRQVDQDLPSEFYVLDMTRVYFAVVAGRRANYTDTTYRMKRRYDRDFGVNVLHYDNLVEAASEVIGKSTY